MNPAKDDRGITLLELLMALALMSIVMAGLFSVFWTGNNAFRTESSYSDAQYYARTAMQKITQDVKSSYRVAGDSLLNDSQLTISVVQNGQTDPVACHYYLNGTTLQRNDISIAKNISYLNFTRASGSDLIQITVESNVNGKTYRLASNAMPRIMVTADGETGEDGQGDTGDEGDQGNTWLLGADGYVGDDQFILPAASQAGLYVSDDQGQTWHVQDINGLFLQNLVEVNDIMWNGQELTGVGEGLIWGRIGTSSDGQDWDDGLPSSVSNLVFWATVSSFNGVAYGKGTYVSVGSTFGGGGRIFTSTDGDEWTHQSPSGTPWWDPLRSYPNSFNGVVFGKNIFVTVGDDGDIYTSANGSTWTARSSDTSADLAAVATSDEDRDFVAVGQNGTIITSNNGVTWTTQNSGVISSLNQAVWVRDKFVVVGDSGTILTSADGQSWDQLVLPDSIDANVRNADIIDVSSCQGVLVAVVDSDVTVDGKNVLLQSNDGGVTWVQKLVED